MASQKDNVVKLENYFTWTEVFSHDGESSSFQVFVNDHNGNAEFVQMNDEGESVRICLSAKDVSMLVDALTPKNVRKQG